MTDHGSVHLKPGDVERLAELMREPLVPDPELRAILDDPRVEEVLSGPDGRFLVRYKGSDAFVAPLMPPLTEI